MTIKSPGPSQQLIKRAMQLQRHGEFEQAKELYRHVLETEARHPDALHLYGLACHQQGDHKTAVEYIRQAVQLVPSQPVLRNNLGDAMYKAGKADAAVKQLRRALELNPDYAGAHQNLCSIFSANGEHDAALVHAREAVRLDPGKPENWLNLGLVLLDHVELEESANAFRRALKLRPAYPAAAASLLYTLNLLPHADPQRIADEHCTVISRLYEQFDIASGSASGSAEQGDSQQRVNGPRIRIAYVSGDFCTHAVNYFFEPILEHHDGELFETWCYSDVARPDDVTQRLMRCAHHWHDIANWSDDEVFKQIKSDRIDILVDLAGHTEHGRPGVFARKPAACQVTYLGFPNTTGMQAMDYRVVDAYTMLENDSIAAPEKLLRLPQGFACFRPPGHAPALTASPVAKNGYVTFGSLHKLEKLNEQTITLWARVLLENPEAKLLLARDQLDDWQKQRLLAIFVRLGVAGERIEMRHLSDPARSFFELFSDIDVLLDTLPWSGHTLACCALWMGVPVISLYGNSHAGRMVASVLQQLDLDELVAMNDAEYTGIAGRLCKDPHRLADLRVGLRDRFQHSKLCDESGFTRSYEKALIQAFQHIIGF